MKRPRSPLPSAISNDKYQHQNKESDHDVVCVQDLLLPVLQVCEFCLTLGRAISQVCRLGTSAIDTVFVLDDLRN